MRSARAKLLVSAARHPGVRPLLQALEQQGGWQPMREDGEGCQGEFQLSGWTRRRRAVVFRRKVLRPARAGDLPLLEQGEVALASKPLYEYVVLVTNLKENLLTLLHLYRQRADVENAYDELKNQWGWGGFTTRD